MVEFRLCEDAAMMKKFDTTPLMAVALRPMEARRLAAALIAGAIRAEAHLQRPAQTSGTSTPPPKRTKR